MRFRLSALVVILFSSGPQLAAMPPVQAAEFQAAPASTSLSLTEALSRAARNRPEIKAVHADLEAAAIKLEHAGLPPNPVLGVEWDNLGGALPQDEDRQTTVSLEQAIETGGKPSARKLKVQAETKRLHQEQTTAWSDIAAEVRLAFLEVLGSRERLALQQETERIASQLVDITRERVAAGELAATEETRAEARMAEITVETQRLKRLLVEAQLNLAVALTEPDNSMLTAEGKLPQEVAIPDPETLLTAVQDSPQLGLRRSEAQLAAAGLALERANSWSDPSLSLAIREFPGQDGRAFVVGLSIPLPLFQRNQSALAEAGALAQKARTNEVATERRLPIELIKAHRMLAGADQEASSLRTGVLTRATAAHEAVQEGYRAGKFRYSDVLEASQSLMTVKARHLDAIIELNRAAIALDRLLGKPAMPESIPQSFSSSLNRNTP